MLPFTLREAEEIGGGAAVVIIAGDFKIVEEIEEMVEGVTIVTTPTTRTPTPPPTPGTRPLGTLISLLGVRVSAIGLTGNPVFVV